MAAPLITCTTIEQRGVVRFLRAKNMEAKDIHIQEMLPISLFFCAAGGFQHADRQFIVATNKC
jgi:hypothetical protein